MEEIKKIEVQGQQYGVADMLMRSVMGGNAQVIEWSHNHNMNDYKETGTYRIKGERTGNPLDDNLPIMNQGSGHTIDGILYVLDSSLPNGSSNIDDCTITQFLMLSNRVGGQEGDMYMRSGYGVNKDNLTWKPWEKYQTNMEVGVVSDSYLLNPSNPTQVIGPQGMSSLTDNGIYSGVYLGPKTMIGTTEDPYTVVINDPTGIETFVMVVINNYAAASNARCITQIKFAVTNGGVFSMEKRSTAPGDIRYWSSWESAGGGSSLISFSNSPLNTNLGGFLLSSPDKCNSFIGTAVHVGNDVSIGNRTIIGDNVHIDREQGISLGSTIIINPTSEVTSGVAECTIGACTINEVAQDKITHKLDTTTIIKGAYLNAIIGTDIRMLGYFTEDSASKERTLIIGTGTIIGKPADSTSDDVTYMGVVIGRNVRIEEGIHISYSESDDGILFSYLGKTALLRF